MQKFIVEYLRPWKLSTLAIGLGLLLIGAEYEQAPDWDYPISFIMASLTYLTAPWAVQFCVNAGAYSRWRCSGTTTGRWQLLAVLVKRQPEALEMREANFLTSSCLYWLCGFIWLHDGPLKTLVSRQTGDATRPAEITKHPHNRKPVSNHRHRVWSRVFFLLGRNRHTTGEAVVPRNHTGNDVGPAKTTSPQNTVSARWKT